MLGSRWSPCSCVEMNITFPSPAWLKMQSRCPRISCVLPAIGRAVVGLGVFLVILWAWLVSWLAQMRDNSSVAHIWLVKRQSWPEEWTKFEWRGSGPSVPAAEGSLFSSAMLVDHIANSGGIQQKVAPPCSVTKDYGVSDNSLQNSLVWERVSLRFMASVSHN